MPETPEFSTTVTLRLKGKAYSKEAIQNRWASCQRYLWQTFGPSNVEVILEPNWEEELIFDDTEQPILEFPTGEE